MVVLAMKINIVDYVNLFPVLFLKIYHGVFDNYKSRLLLYCLGSLC